MRTFKLSKIYISKDRIINIITEAWSTKITSHMDLEELLRQIIGASLKANSKMEKDMDTQERLIKMVSAIKKNIKMVKK